MVSLLSGIGLTALAVGAAWFDLRENRIPNVLTVGGLLLALALRVPGGWSELALGLGGAAIGFAVALPLFLVGGVGGGDVKLLTAVGAFLGTGRIWFALFVMAMVGGAMAVVAIVRRGAYRHTLANLHTIFVTFGRKTFSGWRGEGEGSGVTIHTPGIITVPYGLAIAAGAVVSWAMYHFNPGWSFAESLGISSVAL